MHDCVDSSGEATFFSKLNAESGYWQVSIAEENQDKTTFTCERDTYRFKRMLFGLTNAPATFQPTLDILFSGLNRWAFHVH